MFRFTIRDMLWLTIVVGLGLILWRETQDRKNSLQLLNRFETVADEPALGGAWEIAEKISSGKRLDLDDKPAGRMSFDPPYVSERDSPGDPDFDGEFTVVAPGEIDVSVFTRTGPKAPPQKWRYQLRGRELRIIRSNRPGERPKDFYAISDPALTLYVLRRPESQVEEPPPRPPETKPDPPVADTGKWR
jgi:hypothetical protein